MILSDIELARRLERAQAQACIDFVEAHRRLFPESGAEWMACDGIYAAFDGTDSPITQTFGLGLFEDLSSAALDRIEQYFLERGSPVFHEVSPLAGVAALDLLCARNYRPVEISSVLYREIEKAPDEVSDPIRVQVVDAGSIELWTEISIKGWTSSHPELLDFFGSFSAISSALRQSAHFLADYAGKPGAAGSLGLYDGVALFGGATTIPELRHHGLQSALLRKRLDYAFEHRCDLACMAAEAGSESQRNAERNGFRIAYTRTKWQKLVSS